MTAASTPPVFPPSRRPVDVLGIVAVCVAGAVLLPSLFVFLIGLIPSMNAIWWLGIVLLPILAMAGAVAIVLGIIGVVVGVRRRTRYVLSIVGGVLGILMIAPIAWLFFDSLRYG